MDLDGSGALLIGRAPDPDDLRRTPEEAGRPLTLVDVAAPSVSANHALAWSDGGGVCLRDLGSRNGSWLRLPQGQTVRVGGVDEVVLHLAQATDAAAADDEPSQPTWS